MQQTCFGIPSWPSLLSVCLASFLSRINSPTSSLSQPDGAEGHTSRQPLCASCCPLLLYLVLLSQPWPLALSELNPCSVSWALLKLPSLRRIELQRSFLYSLVQRMSTSRRFNSFSQAGCLMPRIGNSYVSRSQAGNTLGR